MATILEPQVPSVQEGPQSSGSGVVDLALNLNPPQTGCVTFSMSLASQSLHFLIFKVDEKQGFVRIK